MPYVRSIVLFVAVFALALPAPLAGAEGPLDGACDSTGRLVCAGADAGANVSCSLNAAGVATCAWTHGWITTAFSPLALPGSEVHSVTGALTTCTLPGPCDTTPIAYTHECAWPPGLACNDTQGPHPGSATRALAIGQCLRVEIDLHVSIHARVVGSAATLASVTFENAGGDAGVACRDNNGRD